jgi:predicted metal-binding membrane protein
MPALPLARRACFMKHRLGASAAKALTTKRNGAMTDERAGFDNLDQPARLAAWVALKPRMTVNAVVLAAVLLSWATLAALAIQTARVSLPPAGTPGDSLLRLLPDLPLPAWASVFASACLSPAAAGGLLIRWAMWTLMATASMLPSAAPMIRTYCEIADTAAARRQAVAHPLVLVAGYLTIWFAAALAFAAATAVFAGPVAAPASGFAASAILGLAGLYQFSGLKEACLDKCRNPFAILFARWSPKPSRILRLGMEQGLWCLGCCWALMLVMFAVGIMNIFWMALIGLFAAVEKQWDSPIPSRLAGAILLVWAAALTVVSL